MTEQIAPPIYTERKTAMCIYALFALNKKRVCYI